MFWGRTEVERVGRMCPARCVSRSYLSCSFSTCVLSSVICSFRSHTLCGMTQVSMLEDVPENHAEMCATSDSHANTVPNCANVNPNYAKTVPSHEYEIQCHEKGDEQCHKNYEGQCHENYEGQCSRIHEGQCRTYEKHNSHGKCQRNKMCQCYEKCEGPYNCIMHNKCHGKHRSLNSYRTYKNVHKTK